MSFLTTRGLDLIQAIESSDLSHDDRMRLYDIADELLRSRLVCSYDRFVCVREVGEQGSVQLKFVGHLDIPFCRCGFAPYKN